MHNRNCVLPLGSTQFLQNIEQQTLACCTEYTFGMSLLRIHEVDIDKTVDLLHQLD